MTRYEKKKDLPKKPYEAKKFEHGKANSRMIHVEFTDRWLAHYKEIEKDYKSKENLEEYLNSLQLKCEKYLKSKNLPHTRMIFLEIEVSNESKLKQINWTTTPCKEKVGFEYHSYTLTRYLKEIKNYTHDDLETIAADIISNVELTKTEQPNITQDSYKKIRDRALFELGLLNIQWNYSLKSNKVHSQIGSSEKTPEINGVIKKLAKQKISSDETAKKLWPIFISTLYDLHSLDVKSVNDSNKNDTKNWEVNYLMDKKNAKPRKMTFKTFSTKLSTELKKLK